MLRKKAKPVQRVNASIRKILDKMLLTMREESGAGLAAPQVGISKRMVVVDVGEGPYFLVNPEIVSRSAESELNWEGCLSWPGYVGEVERPLRVTVKALDRDGHDIWVEGEGFLARALCHEIDHLDGILYIDRAETIAEVRKDEEPVEGAPGEEKQPTAVFMGSPDFAVPALVELLQSGVKITLVVSQPDRPVGRKQVMTPTPVKERALALGCPWPPMRTYGSRSLDEVAGWTPTHRGGRLCSEACPMKSLRAANKATLNILRLCCPSTGEATPVQRAGLNGETVPVSIIHQKDGRRRHRASSFRSR